MKCINKALFLFLVNLLTAGVWLSAMQPDDNPPPPPSKVCPPTPRKGRSGLPPRTPAALGRTPSFGEGGAGIPRLALNSRAWLVRRPLMNLFSSPLVSPAAAQGPIALVDVQGCFRRFFNRLGNGFNVLANAERLEFELGVFGHGFLELGAYTDQMVAPAIVAGGGRFSFDDINKIFDVYVREPFADETLFIPHMGVGMAVRPPVSAASSTCTATPERPLMGSGSSSVGRVCFTTPVKHIVARLTSEDIMYRLVSHVLRSPAGSVDRNLRRFTECFFSITMPGNELHPRPVVPSIGNHQSALVDVINKLVPRVLFRVNAFNTRVGAINPFEVDALRDELSCCFDIERFRADLADPTPAFRALIARPTQEFRESLVAEKLEPFIESCLPQLRALIIDSPLCRHYEVITLGIVLYYLLKLGDETLVALEREAQEKRIQPFIDAMRQRRATFEIVRRQFIARFGKECMMNALEAVGLDTLVHFEPESKDRLEAQVRHLIFTLHCYRSAMPEVYLVQQTDRYYRDAIRLYKLVNDSIVAALNELDEIDRSLELLSMKACGPRVALGLLCEDAETVRFLRQRHEELASSLAAAYDQIKQRINIMGPVLSGPIGSSPLMPGVPGDVQVYSYAYKNLLLLAKAIEIYLCISVNPINFDNILFIKDYHAYQVTNEPGCSDPSGGHFAPAVQLATMPGYVYPAVDLFELSDEVLGAIMGQNLRVRDFVEVARHEPNGVRSGEWKIVDEAAPRAEQLKQSTLFPECHREHYFTYVQRLASAFNNPAVAHARGVLVYRTEGMPNAREGSCLSRLGGVCGHEHSNEKLLLRQPHFYGCGSGIACSICQPETPMWVMMYRHCDRFIIRGQSFTVTAIHSVFPMLIDEISGAPLGDGIPFVGLHELGNCELTKKEGSDRYEKRDM